MIEIPASHPYHHGNLRRALLDAAVAVIATSGPSELSLRGVAGRLGVSHAAPAHHFHDRIGLLTAVAVEGYELFGADLSAAYARRASLLDLGVAYVRFAIERRPYFDVMFRPDLYRRGDPELVAALKLVDDTV